MRAILVDDERLARSEMRRLLTEHPDIEIAGEAATIEEAGQLVLMHRPELVFLDVEMPGGSGFELIDRLDPMPAIIFTTAFDRYALRAFEVRAMDYLLKPVAPRRLAEALQRVRAALDERRLDPPPQFPLRQFFVRDGDRCWMVQAADLRLIESEGNYARLHFEGNRPLILRSLQSLQQRLDASVFFRANRNQIINLQWIASIELNPDASLTVILRDGTRIEMSRRQSQVLRDRMSL